MAASVDFDRLLASSQGPGQALVLVDPRTIAGLKPPITAAWRLLSGSIALRRAGHTSEANGWFNASMALKMVDGHRVLRAESVSEGGLGLFADKRFADAGKILHGAATQWMDLCGLALAADKEKTVGLAREIGDMLDALGARLPAARMTGTGASSLVRAWLEDRAVPRRAAVFAAFARVLATAGQFGDAGKVIHDTIDWIGNHFTRPANLALHKRDMTGATRRALYTTLLAHGEVELAAGKFKESADRFGDAVRIYDGHVEDTADMSRMIQAHVNQANSLLRLGRYDEALGIYGLAQMGFRSINDEASAARVEHAKLMALSKKAEAGES